MAKVKDSTQDVFYKAFLVRTTEAVAGLPHTVDSSRDVFAKSVSGAVADMLQGTPCNTLHSLVYAMLWGGDNESSKEDTDELRKTLGLTPIDERRVIVFAMTFNDIVETTEENPDLGTYSLSLDEYPYMCFVAQYEISELEYSVSDAHVLVRKLQLDRSLDRPTNRDEWFPQTMTYLNPK